MAKRFVNKEAARGRGEYEKVIDRIIKDGVCPFCEAHFLKYHTKPILRRGKYWIVTENMNPYEGTKRHMLFVLRRHISDPKAMDDREWRELLAQLRYVSKKFKLAGGSFYMRFGEPRYTGASVAHLHANVLVGAAFRNDTEAIRVKLGFKKKSPRA